MQYNLHRICRVIFVSFLRLCSVGRRYRKDTSAIFMPASSHLLTLRRSFKANPASIVSTTVDDETGEEKKRMINRMRWKGYGPATIMFSDSHVRYSRSEVHELTFTQVPEKPPQAVQEGRSQINETILKRLEEVRFCLLAVCRILIIHIQLFMERPVWTRMSLFNQFTPLETREILK